ncbi:hypothetical protein [Nonomuraea maritima]|uniref:hypothetical protein n=1 Tax=Nonomuraea maritima TaxID=683260 RepID=UPI0037184E13
MDDSGPGIAGFRLTTHTWMTELGHWIDAVSPDGRRAGALLFEPRIIGRPEVRDRVVRAVLTDQRLVRGGMTGLIPVADVVAAGDQVWLLTAQAVSPTVADLLDPAQAGSPVEPGGAASVLVDTARTLLALHAAGVTHGAVQPRTVVITPDGAALLSERGLTDAVRDRVSPPDDDVAGWAALARTLAASLRPAAGVLERAAVTAGTYGLAAALDLLLHPRESRIDRGSLSRAARARSGFAQPSPYAPARHERDEGDIVTLLHVPAGATGPARSALETTTREQRGETPAERIWRSGRDSTTARRRRSRRRRTVLSAVVLALILTGAAVAWQRLGAVPELAVTSVEVTAPEKTQGCDTVAAVTGTVVTNGAPGEIVYEWTKNLDDDVVKGKLRTRSDRTSYTLPLRWTLRGEGDVTATATLRILEPGPVRSYRASFDYTC